MLIGLIAPTAGTVRLFGRDLAAEPSVLRRVGSLVDGGAFYPFLSGRRNLEVLARTHGGGGERIDDLARSGRPRQGREAQGEGLFHRHAPAARGRRGPARRSRDRHPRRAGERPRRRRHPGDAPADPKPRRRSRQDRLPLQPSARARCSRSATASRSSTRARWSANRRWRACSIKARPGSASRREPIEAAEAALRPRWPVERHGASLIVAATRAEAPEVARRLVGAGRRSCSAWRPVQRNLEDVFLAITQEEPADA